MAVTKLLQPGKTGKPTKEANLPGTKPITMLDNNGRPTPKIIVIFFIVNVKPVSLVVIFCGQLPVSLVVDHKSFNPPRIIRQLIIVTDGITNIVHKKFDIIPEYITNKPKNPAVTG